jgi:hypothetical protein
MRTTGTRACRRRAVLAALALSIVSAAGVCGLGVATANTPDPCAVLPASQLRSWFGKEVVSRPTRGGPQEAGCQWLPKDGSPGGLALMFGPASSYSPPAHRFGYKPLSGIGDKAYTVPIQGGWEAGALKGGKSVWARSPNLSNTIATTLLKMTVAKLQ